MSATKARVLVVDGDPSTMEALRVCLRLAGYDVAGASSGGEALAALDAARAFQLLLVDLRLPDMSGLEVVATVSESRPGLPVVMMAGSGTRITARAARQLGAADYLDKPIVDGRLTETIERTLARSERPPRHTAPSTLGYAAERWAALIVPLTRLQADIPTLVDWSLVVGHSRSAIKTRCHAAGVRAGDSLDFARALRIIVQYEGRPCDWYNHLAILDPRTLGRFLEQGGLSSGGRVPSLSTFLQRQCFVTAPHLAVAVHTVLHEPRR